MQPLLLSIFLVVRRSLKPELRKRSCHAVSLCSLTTDQGPGGVISVGDTRKLGMISNGISAAKIAIYLDGFGLFSLLIIWVLITLS